MFIIIYYPCNYHNYYNLVSMFCIIFEVFICINIVVFFTLNIQFFIKYNGLKLEHICHVKYF